MGEGDYFDKKKGFRRGKGGIDIRRKGNLVKRLVRIVTGKAGRGEFFDYFT